MTAPPEPSGVAPSFESSYSIQDESQAPTRIGTPFVDQHSAPSGETRFARMSQLPRTGHATMPPPAPSGAHAGLARSRPSAETRTPPAGQRDWPSGPRR